MVHALLWASAGTGFTTLMTTAGAAMVFFFRRPASSRLHQIMLGFAAGVMIASSMWSLLIPAIQLSLIWVVPDGFRPQAARCWVSCFF